MSLKRRQLLLLGGAFCGLGLTPLIHKAFTPNHSVNSSAAIKPLSQQDSLSALASAAKGLQAPPRGEVRIVVISDLNSQYGSTSYEPEVDRAIAFIPDWKPDLVLCGGDMVAGQKSSLTKSQIEAMWAAFDRHIASPLRKSHLPLGFTIGNHDGSGAVVQGKIRFQSERDLAAAYWNNSQHHPGLQFVERAGFPFYYSFTQNDIFYLVWDASNDRIPAQQLTWVEKSLASRTAQEAKMRIVIGHLPLYAVAVGRNKVGEVLAGADKLRSLLERYHVHTYISGHQHAYFPGKRGQLELLQTGALGSGPRQLLNSNLPPIKTLTVVDINLNSASTIYTTYNMETLSVIDARILPRIVVGFNGWVLRRDVNEEELSSIF